MRSEGVEARVYILIATVNLLYAAYHGATGSRHGCKEHRHAGTYVRRLGKRRVQIHLVVKSDDYSTVGIT